MDIEDVIVEVVVGKEAKDFSQGDLLNSIDQVVKYFSNSREISDGEIVNALHSYADYIKETA